VTSMCGGSAWPAGASLCSARIASTGPRRHDPLDASGSTCNDGGRASGRFPRAIPIKVFEPVVYS